MPLKLVNSIIWRTTFVKSLDKDDYIIDIHSKTIGLSDSGIDKAESYFKLENCTTLKM